MAKGSGGLGGGGRKRPTADRIINAERTLKTGLTNLLTGKGHQPAGGLRGLLSRTGRVLSPGEINAIQSKINIPQDQLLPKYRR